MNAKDLMIGDWVFNEIPCYVTAIYHNGTIDCQGDNQSISTDSVDPIPLNAEILEKNGFWCEHDVGYVTEEYEYEIIYSTWNHELRILKNREQILKLKYFDEMCVHELQHAMRLAGIDKEITI